jgi:hypothetical protein
MAKSMGLILPAIDGPASAPAKTAAAAAAPVPAKVALPPFDEKTPFNCTACTMLNSKGGRFCMVCGTKRDVEAEQKAAQAEALLRAEAEQKKKAEQKIEAYHINVTIEQGASSKNHRIEIPSRTFTVADFRSLVAKAEGLPTTSVTQLYVKAPGAASPRILIEDSKGGKLLTMADVDGLVPATAGAGAAPVMPECILVLAAETMDEALDEEDQLEYALALSEGRPPNLKKKGNPSTGCPMPTTYALLSTDVSLWDDMIATDVKEIVNKLLNPNAGGQHSDQHPDHPLFYTTKNLQEHYCDLCQQPDLTEAWRCSKCNFDICPNCMELTHVPAPVIEETKTTSGPSTSTSDNKTELVDATSWWSQCIELFREELGLELQSTVPKPIPFSEKLAKVVEKRSMFLTDAAARNTIRDVVTEVQKEEKPHHVDGDEKVETDRSSSSSALEFDTEMVQEQEQEQEQEREVEEEQQVVVDYATNPNTSSTWSVNKLASANDLIPSIFYPLATFTATKRGSPLPYPASVLLSENYAPFMHRSDLARRLKNVTTVMEWSPAVTAVTKFIRPGFDPKDDDSWTAQAYRQTIADATKSSPTSGDQKEVKQPVDLPPPKQYCVALSLAEAVSTVIVVLSRMFVISTISSLAGVCDRKHCVVSYKQLVVYL